MVTDYTQWKAAVTAEYKKLAEVRYYLNENGKNRLRAFVTLITLSDYCSTPEELLAWIDSKERLEKYDVGHLESGHVMSAVSALRRIVKRTREKE